MLDPTFTANAVANWTNLGVALPKSLTNAIDIYEAVRHTEVGHEPRFDASGLTPANAEARIRAYAQELTLSLRGSADRPQSVIWQAQRNAIQITARVVLEQAVEAVPAIIEGLTPAFDEAVAAFTEAVKDLPVDVTHESVFDGGPAVLTVYQAAEEAAGTIHRIETWVESLSDLTSSDVVKALRVLAPSTRAELAELINAGQEDNSPLVNRLGAEFVYAARNDIAFKINTPKESGVLLAELESQPVESKVRHMRF